MTEQTTWLRKGWWEEGNDEIQGGVGGRVWVSCDEVGRLSNVESVLIRSMRELVSQ